VTRSIVIFHFMKNIIFVLKLVAVVCSLSLMFHAVFLRVHFRFIQNFHTIFCVLLTPIATTMEGYILPEFACVFVDFSVCNLICLSFSAMKVLQGDFLEIAILNFGG